LENGRFGIIARESQLGDALVGLLRDSSMRETFSKLGYERAQEYDWDRIVDQYENVYQRVLSQNKISSVNSVPSVLP
jgi:glycosyltransferase involved in cell wall biosynthesis